MISKTGILVLLAIYVLLYTASCKNSHKTTTSSHSFRHMKNHYDEETEVGWYGPFQLCSDVTYALYLDTEDQSTAENATVVVNSMTTVDTQTWYFNKLEDGNFSVYNKGAQQYLTLSSDKKSFYVAPYIGSDYQRFYARSFWNGYTFNSQIDLGYYNYLTVSINGTVKSQYYNGNPKTQFFQLVGTAKLDLA